MKGLGVMINELAGNEDSTNALKSVLNKKIMRVYLDKEENALRFEFEDGTKFRIFDHGQNCCERRYMTTDDNLGEFKNAVFLDALIKDGPTTDDEHGEPHEVQFLEIRTNKGSFVMTNHNEHNGYYGGFSIIGKLEND